MTEVTLKPNWDKAPEWAEWWAVDENGQCYWYKRKPYLSRIDKYWNYPDLDCKAELVIIDGWKESLQERPLKMTEPRQNNITLGDVGEIMTASLESKLDRIIELLEIGQVVYVDTTQRIEDLLKKEQEADTLIDPQKSYTIDDLLTLAGIRPPEM